MLPQTTRVPRKWTAAEDSLLQEKVEQCKNAGKPVYWGDIAAAFQDRTNNDCRKRWAKMDEKWKRGAWDSHEEELLRQGVKEFEYRWTNISRLIESRSPDQCAKHWRNSLDPNISRSDWTGEEDATLTEAVEYYGNDWKVIHEKFFPKRSRLDLSNRYVSITRQQKRKHSQSSSSSALIRGQENNIQAEPAQMLNLRLTSHDSGIKPHGSSSLDMATTSENNQTAITAWMSQGFQAKSIEGLASRAFPAAVQQSGANDRQAHDGLFNTMNFNQESDDNSLSLTFDHSSGSLYPFPETTLSSDLYDTHSSLMSLSPMTPETVFPEHERHQAAHDLDAWPALTDGPTELPATHLPGAATPSLSTGVLTTLTLTKRVKTILTLEDLDPETRGEIVDLLCKRKITTKIEIE